MNRYPNIIPSGGGLLSARGNGFLRRKAFTVAGTYSFTLPSDLPVDDRGLIRVMGWCLGAGAGGYSNKAGAAGGFSQKERWVPPESTFSIVVGAAGIKEELIGTHTGGTSSITIDGVTWQATGGQTSNGGEGSGGDINTKGGPAVTSVGTYLGGASAGSPWGDGDRARTTTHGAPWKMPAFWDLDDITSAEAFVEVEGIGRGGGPWVPGSPGSFAHLPTWGGGGAGGGGTSGDADGADGLAVIFW